MGELSGASFQRTGFGKNMRRVMTDGRLGIDILRDEYTLHTWGEGNVISEYRDFTKKKETLGQKIEISQSQWIFLGIND